MSPNGDPAVKDETLTMTALTFARVPVSPQIMDVAITMDVFRGI